MSVSAAAASFAASMSFRQCNSHLVYVCVCMYSNGKSMSVFQMENNVQNANRKDRAREKTHKIQNSFAPVLFIVLLALKRHFHCLRIFMRQLPSVFNKRTPAFHFSCYCEQIRLIYCKTFRFSFDGERDV